MSSILTNLPRAATADRRVIIGASEVAAVLGLDPWRTPFGVWASRQDDAERQDETTVMERGQFMESGIIAWGAHRLGVAEVEPGVALSEPAILSPLPFLAARPDAVYHYADGHAELAEAKSSDADGFDDNDCPEHYRVQCLVQLACVPMVDVVRVPAYLPIRRKFVCPAVERDDDLIARILELLADFHYRHLDPHGPMTSPPIDASDDATEWLRRCHPEARSPLREATAAEVALAVDYAKARASEKAAGAEKTRLRNLLADAVADAEGLDLGAAGKVTYRTRSGASRLDGAALKAALPEVVKQYTVKGASYRALTVSVKGMDDE